MFPVYMSASPWDVAGQGAVEVLDRLQGELGVSGVTLSAAMPPQMALRNGPASPGVFRTRGGMFFHPSSTRYEDTRCKPIVSGWIRSREPLKDVASACSARNLSLRVVVSATRTGRLAQRYPELACKNVFGDVSQESLCLSNGDVRAYLSDVVADLAGTYSLEAVLLDDVQVGWSEAWRDDLIAPARLGRSARALLSLCFCESCYQQAAAANLDLSGVRETVTGLLQRMMQTGQADDRELAPVLADNEPLSAYRHTHQDAMVEALKGVRGVSGGTLGLYVHDNAGQLDSLVESAGFDLVVVKGELDRPVQGGVADRATVDGRMRRDVQLGVWDTAKSAADLVRSFQEAVEGGYAAIEVGPWGQLPAATGKALKQAIRFAGRSGSP